MKKIAKLLSVFVFLLTLAGCSVNVSGKTFVYESFDYKLEEDLTGLEEAAAELAVTAVKKLYEYTEITFNEDGTTSLGQEWKQEGSTLTVDGTAYKVEGSLIVLTIDEEDYDITIKLAEKKAE